MFKFGSRDPVKSLYRVKIPASIGNQDIFSESDAVDNDIPMLLSKSAMKKTNTSIDFQSDTVTMLGQKQLVIITTSGHYAIPLGSNQQILKDSVESPDKTRITLISRNSDPMSDKKKVAHKLHSQFSHPTAEKLIKLVNSSGLSDDQKLKDQIYEVSRNCVICQIYKRPSPHPVVGLPLAIEFNEVVAMDLKQCEGDWILHLVDHVSRYSAAALIKSKRKEVIIEHIFKIWISVFGPPSSHFSDNGEFNNEEFREMCEAINIVVKTTAAEAPWSNGLCERHNEKLSEMMIKTRAEAK